MSIDIEARNQQKLAKIRKEMAQYDMFGRVDVENAIEFVEALMEIEIKDTEKYENYATRSIQDMRIARDRIVSLYHSLSDIRDEI
jgi:hypothetical protein